MKRWGFTIAGLYFIALMTLSFPLCVAAFWPEETIEGAFALCGSLFYWIWIAIVICGELLLLLIPIENARQRLKGRRPLLVPIITSSFFFAMLAFLLVTSIIMGIWGDDGPPILSELSDPTILIMTCISIVALWTVWGSLFYNLTRSDPPETVTKRITSWLFKGSVLELLVAVSCHVIVRRRGDCCAPYGTFIGIAAGLSVMLLSFGPGVFFLFQERSRRLKPKETETISP